MNHVQLSSDPALTAWITQPDGEALVVNDEASGFEVQLTDFVGVMGYRAPIGPPGDQQPGLPVTRGRMYLGFDFGIFEPDAFRARTATLQLTTSVHFSPSIRLITSDLANNHLAVRALIGAGVLPDHEWWGCDRWPVGRLDLSALSPYTDADGPLSGHCYQTIAVPVNPLIVTRGLCVLELALEEEGPVPAVGTGHFVNFWRCHEPCCAQEAKPPALRIGYE